jgi:mannose/fructose-specific phosphotransferase system component IIA
VKRSGCEANHSPPSSAKVKNVSSYTSNPDYAYVQGTNLPLLLEVISKFYEARQLQVMSFVFF